jgi:predicted nuclease of predicted toxin-antitoxin system
MAEKPKLRFFLDNCVPDSVGRILVAAGHEVIYQRDVIARDAPDLLVALASAANEAILVTFDRDHKAIASRFNVSNRKLKTLSRIDLRCTEPQAAERIAAGLSLIEAEWLIAQGASDRRLFMEVQSAAFKTNR